MPATGILDAVLSAIGDEINSRVGKLATLTTQQLSPRAIVQSGAGLRNASTVNGTTITFPAASINTGIVVAGHILRLTTDATVVPNELVIATVSSDMQLIVSAPGFTPIVLSNHSWEIWQEADETFFVESTFDFPDTGLFFANGQLYRYSGRTPTSFTGVEYLDVVGTWRPGTPSEVPVVTEVVAFDVAFSALDESRRSLFLRTAEGTDLDIVGAGLGVRRHPATQDNTYRGVVEAIAYAPRGTIYALEQALDALVGAGNYEIFEDLTNGRDYDDALVTPPTLHENNRVFIRIDVAALAPTEFQAKAFVEAPECVPLDATLQAATLSATRVHAPGTTVIGATLPPDPWPVHVVTRSTATITIDASGPNNVAATDPKFGRVLPGDILVIEAGDLLRRRYVISAKTSPTLLTAYQVHQRFSELPSASTPATSWYVYRDPSQWVGYRPSEEYHEQYPGSPNEEQTWIHSDPMNEAADVTIGVNSGILFANTANNLYEHRARLVPESDAIADLNVQFDNANISNIVGDADQFIFELDDGERIARVGVLAGAINPTVGLIDAAGAFLNTPTNTLVSESVLDTVRTDIRIHKQGRRDVRVYVRDETSMAWRLVHVVAYASLIASAGPATNNPRLRFGVLVPAAIAPIPAYSCRWRIVTDKDYWNTVASMDLGAPNSITDPGSNNLFSASTKTVRVLDWITSNADGGLPIGEWEVASVGSPNAVTVRGFTHQRGATTFAYPSQLTSVVDPGIFRFPHLRGQQIELLTGDDAGIYDIATLHDSYSLADLDPNTVWTSKAGIDAYKLSDPGAPLSYEARTSTLRVDNPPVGGFAASHQIDFRIIPNFPVTAGVPVEVVGTGTMPTSNTISLQAPVPLNYDLGVYEPVICVQYNTVLSAQVVRQILVNALNGNELVHYAFYLYDSAGFVRDYLNLLMPAGNEADFARLSRDLAGAHVAPIIS